MRVRTRLTHTFARQTKLIRRAGMTELLNVARLNLSVATAVALYEVMRQRSVPIAPR